MFRVVARVLLYRCYGVVEIARVLPDQSRVVSRVLLMCFGGC